MMLICHSQYQYQQAQNTPKTPKNPNPKQKQLNH